MDTNIPRFNTRAVYLLGPDEYPNAPLNRGAHEALLKKDNEIRDHKPNGTPELKIPPLSPKTSLRSDPYDPNQ